VRSVAAFENSTKKKSSIALNLVLESAIGKSRKVQRIESFWGFRLVRGSALGGAYLEIRNTTESLHAAVA